MFYVRAIAVYSKLLTFNGLVSFANLTTIAVVSVSLKMFSGRRVKIAVRVLSLKLLRGLMLDWCFRHSVTTVVININALFLLPTSFS